MSASSTGRRAGKQSVVDGVEHIETQQYIERIKLKELFQVSCPRCFYSMFEPMLMSHGS